MSLESMDLKQLVDNWFVVTWQLGDRERQLRNTLISPEESLDVVLQRILMESCVMGFINHKLAFTEPNQFAKSWQVFVYRGHKEELLPNDIQISEIGIIAGERLIIRPAKTVNPDANIMPSDANFPSLSQFIAHQKLSRTRGLTVWLIILAIALFVICGLLLWSYLL
jgi:hypothetical protein